MSNIWNRIEKHKKIMYISIMHRKYILKLINIKKTTYIYKYILGRMLNVSNRKKEEFLQIVQVCQFKGL
uniref:Uncharacterized protein n=1 Tax=Physcomitrium patens TaxID=3218 RepID=A0A2K1L7B6_PHYPA|nr:hypothetical protein PHYPA_000308 [Physcomitrium patens]